MNPPTPTADESLLITAWRRIDEVCLRFEAAWREGGRPKMLPFLVGFSGPERSRLFQELLAIDLEISSASGERRESGSLREAFPEYLDAIDSAFATREQGFESTRLKATSVASTVIRGREEGSRRTLGREGRHRVKDRSRSGPAAGGQGGRLRSAGRAGTGRHGGGVQGPPGRL